jgi:hypothetical protein
MGICNSKKKGNGDTHRAASISDVSGLGVGKGMFILSNDGKFKEKYSLG